MYVQSHYQDQFYYKDVRISNKCPEASLSLRLLVDSCCYSLAVPGVPLDVASHILIFVHRQILPPGV